MSKTKIDRKSITLHELYQDWHLQLQEAGIKTPALDARLLLQHGLNIDHASFIGDQNLILPNSQVNALTDLLHRRLAHEPVSRIIEIREFWGHNFTLSPHTLDPRPDSETLVELALEVYADQPTPPQTILDLGTGSGCLLLSLLAEWPGSHGLGIDLNRNALAIASENARNIGLEDRARFVQSDWLSSIDHRFDLIIANPPYIPSSHIPQLELEVSHYDPPLALDGGPDGLEAYRTIIANLEAVMTPHSWVIFELGEGQIDAVQKMIVEEKSLTGEKIFTQKHDLAGIARTLAFTVSNELKISGNGNN